MKRHKYLLYTLLLWVSINLISVLHGIPVANLGPLASNTCNYVTRIDYVFPGTFLGCWLGETVIEIER